MRDSLILRKPAHGIVVVHHEHRDLLERATVKRGIDPRLRHPRRGTGTHEQCKQARDKETRHCHIRLNNKSSDERDGKKLDRYVSLCARRDSLRQCRIQLTAAISNVMNTANNMLKSSAYPWTLSPPPMVNPRSRPTRYLSGLTGDDSAQPRRHQVHVIDRIAREERAHGEKLAYAHEARSRVDDASDDGGWSACVTATAFIAPLYCLCKQHERLRYCVCGLARYAKKRSGTITPCTEEKGRGMDT